MNQKHHMNKHLLFFLLAAILCLQPAQGCSSEEKKISRNGFYFDTIITITLYGTEDDKLIQSCFDMASDYEHKFSNTIETSEISKINHAAGKFVAVSDDTAELLSDAIEYGKISDGKFDITIGGLSDLWNFSEIAENLKTEDNEADPCVLPSDAAVQKQLAYVDYRNLEIQGNRVKLNKVGAKLDVGGIAKGYIADKMREFLNKKGITKGVISLGGNVLTLGEKQDKPYTIGIQKPFAETGTALASLQVKDASIVTSGIYERYYRVNGRLYHHLLDTATGYPIDNHLEQVTIISKSSMDGDALSTTCFALGLEKGMDLIEKTEDVEAVFVTDDGKLHESSGIGKNKGITLTPLS